MSRVWSRMFPNEEFPQPPLAPRFTVNPAPSPPPTDDDSAVTSGQPGDPAPSERGLNDQAPNS